MLITCSNCQSKIRVPDAAAGKKGKCPKCGSVITIPSEGESAEETGATAEAPGAAANPFDFGEPGPAPRRAKGSAAADEVEEDGADEAGGGEVAGRSKQPESIGLSVTSLVLGILSLLCGCGSFGSLICVPVPFLCAIGALITGFLGMKRGGKVMAIVGMSLGGVSILLAIAAIIFGIFFAGLGILGGILGGGGR